MSGRILQTHRATALYIECARVHVDGDRVVYYSEDDREVRRYNIPHANLSILFLGNGTSLTKAAANLLANEKVFVAFTGTGGTPLHYGALTSYQTTEHFRRLLPIYMDPAKSLHAGKSMMEHRCQMISTLGSALAAKSYGKTLSGQLGKLSAVALSDFKKATSIEELLGYEGKLAKTFFALHAKAAGINFKRIQSARGKNIEGPLGRVNALIDHGNYLAYGVAGACLWALGVPPHLSVFHGKTRQGGLVFDLADAFKDAIIIPLAFKIGTSPDTGNPEKEFREEVINTFDDHNIMAKCFAAFDHALNAGENDA